MVFIKYAISDVPMKEVLKGACSNSKRIFPEDDSPERIESLSIQALRSSSSFNICEKKRN